MLPASKIFKFSIACWPPDTGGVIDDILVYRQPYGYIVVCNASNRPAVNARFNELRQGAEGNFTDRTLDTAMIAIQGPHALETLAPLYDQPLQSVPYYHFSMGQILGNNAVVSRTGYTGEDGYEVIVSARAALPVWEALLESGKSHGIKACGLGARDTLRLEAAMPLYGHELSESINPYAAGVGWAVKLQKGEFAGRRALADWKDAPGFVRVGFHLESKRIARQGAGVYAGDQQVGEVTSGTFSPTLQASVAMALVDPSVAATDVPLTVDIRGHREPARLVKLPFFKRARAVA